MERVTRQGLKKLLKEKAKKQLKHQYNLRSKVPLSDSESETPDSEDGRPGPHTPHSSHTESASESSSTDSHSSDSEDQDINQKGDHSPPPKLNQQDSHNSGPQSPDNTGNTPPQITMGATVEQIRLAMQQILGNLGPALAVDGKINEEGATQPTLTERLANINSKSEVTKPPGPEKFRGTLQENATEWIEMMTDYLNFTGHQSEEKKMAIVKLYLADQARIWYKTLLPAQKNTFATFSTSFNEKYTRPEARYTAEQQLMNRRMKTGEKAQDYVKDVLLQAEQLKWENRRTMQHLMAGISPKLKPHVIMAHPQTLQEACEIIQRAEIAQQTDTTELAGIQATLEKLTDQLEGHNKVANLRPALDRPTTGRKPPYRRDRQASQPAHTAPPTVPQLPPQPIVIHTAGMQQPQVYSPRPMRGRGSTPRSQPPRQYQLPGYNNTANCWICGDPQHFAKNCPRIRTNYFSNMASYNPQPNNYWNNQYPSFRRRNNFQRRSGPMQGRPIQGRQQFQEN